MRHSSHAKERVKPFNPVDIAMKGINNIQLEKIKRETSNA